MPDTNVRLTLDGQVVAFQPAKKEEDREKPAEQPTKRDILSKLDGDRKIVMEAGLVAGRFLAWMFGITLFAAVIIGWCLR